jgi:hypothetical protein
MVTVVAKAGHAMATVVAGADSSCITNREQIDV